ncbi:MAG TPA: ABC transporter permease [Dehalococcoidales bacterium]|nr:ABC transporter permease [Dehalococcoidales bacterium]
MNLRIIRALLKKDVKLFLNNRFYLLITILGIVFYVGAYMVLPAKQNETLRMALYAPQLPAAFLQVFGHQGFEVERFQNRDALKQAVAERAHQVGIALPEDISSVWAAGQKPQIDIFHTAGTPPEMIAAVTRLVEELSFIQTGQVLAFSIQPEILGPDMLGDQIPLRDRLRPLLVVFILLVEIMTLASLISIEIEQGTVRALLITPLRMPGLFAAKGILGAGLAFLQGVLFMLLVGGFNQSPLIVLTTLFLCSLFVVGAAFLLASLSRDVNAVTGWGLLVLIILAVPGFGAAIPGLLPAWIKIVPSYYLTDTLNRVINYAQGWQDIWLNLLIIAVLAVVLIWGGMLALRRRYQ